MLVLGRSQGQYVEVVHSASGDSMMIGVARIYRARNGQALVNLAFDDAPRAFAIDRPGRRVPPAPQSIAQSTSPVAQDPPASPALSSILANLDRLHALELAGRNDSPEADAVRDAMDGPWRGLDPDEQRRAEAYSAGLRGPASDVPTDRAASPMCG